MPWRFRKSITILPGVRINLSRRGVSVSTGVPGTGVSYHTEKVPYRGGRRPGPPPLTDELAPVVYVPVEEVKPRGLAFGCLAAVALGLGLLLIVIVFGLIVSPPKRQPEPMGANWRVTGGAADSPPPGKSSDGIGIASPRQEAASSRCTARTRLGTRCRKMVVGGGRCHVHRLL